MKKFLIKVFSFVILIAVLTTAINTAYLARVPDGDTAKFHEMPEQIQICNFGSSHGQCSYNYEDLRSSFSCFNFALDSQFLSYDARILETYQDHLQEGGTAFITVSFFSFFEQDETESADFESKNKRYYEFLPPDQIKNYDAKTAFFVTKFPSLTAYADLLKVLSSWQAPAAGVNTTTPESAQASAMGAYERHVKDNIDSNGNRLINRNEIDCLYQMIALCRDAGVTPILITTPYLSEYTSIVHKEDPTFHEDFYHIIDQVISDTGVDYHDYSEDPRFSTEYALFRNADHLNEEGARVFTDILAEEVLQLRLS